MQLSIYDSAYVRLRREDTSNGKASPPCGMSAKTKSNEIKEWLNGWLKKIRWLQFWLNKTKQ